MHRHGYQGRKFGRAAGPRRAMLRSLATSLVLQEAVTTTEAKAKELKPVVDRLITQAKQGTLADRRRVAAYLHEELAVQKLFSETAPYYKERSSGFTRLTRVGVRKGDGSSMIRIELIDYKPVIQKPEARSQKPEVPEADASEASEPVAEETKPATEEKPKPKPRRTKKAEEIKL